MTSIYFEYETNIYTIDEPEDSDEPYSYNGQTGGNYQILRASLTPGFRDRFDAEEDIEIGDEVAVVWVSYSTGNTFGSSGGCGQIVCVTKDIDLAMRAYDWITEDNYHGSKKNVAQPPWPSALGEEPVRDWVGYFESLESKNIETFRVMP